MRSIIAVAAFAVALLTSCNDSVVYHHYEHIADEGWDVRDTVTFQVDTIQDAGTYTMSLAVRSTAAYPYRNLSLMVFQTLFHRNDSTKGYIQDSTMLYTIPMVIKQEDGSSIGQGVAYFTNEKPFATATLFPGDSLAVVVRHHMRREVLPGITDIGIKITKK